MATCESTRGESSFVSTGLKRPRETESDDQETDSEAEVEAHLLDFAAYTRVMSDGSRKPRSEARMKKLRKQSKRNRKNGKLRMAEDPWGHDESAGAGADEQPHVL